MNIYLAGGGFLAVVRLRRPLPKDERARRTLVRRTLAPAARRTLAPRWANALRCVTQGPLHAEPAHRLTLRMPCCPQNQKEGLRKPKSGNSKPPDGLQGVAMAKGKSLPHSHSNPGHAGPSHLLTCLYTWQRGGRSNVRSWLRSWIRREAASKAPRVRARERMRRRSCLRIKSRAACGRTASHEPARWSLGGPVVSRGSRRALPSPVSPCHTCTRTQSRHVLSADTGQSRVGMYSINE